MDPYAKGLYRTLGAHRSLTDVCNMGERRPKVRWFV